MSGGLGDMVLGDLGFRVWGLRLRSRPKPESLNPYGCLSPTIGSWEFPLVIARMHVRFREGTCQGFGL